MTERAPYEVAFVIEQALGHITHGANLRVHVPSHPGIRPHWVLPSFEVSGIGSHVPLYASNWTVRAGLTARRALRRINSETKLDALFFHTQVPAMMCSDWVRRIPTVISLDATPRQYDELGAHYGHEVGSPRAEQLKQKVATNRLAQARHLVTWSQWAKQGLIDDYAVAPERVEVIPPGVTLSDWTAPPRRTQDDRPVRLLFVGGDLARKGGLLLLEAFRAVRHLGAELHIVTRDEVPALDGVFVHHNVGPNSPELRRLYGDSDIFVLPTLGDCLPMVLSEAAASGLPTISTRVAAIPEVVLDGETGILISGDDVRELSASLGRLIENPQERIQMGARALEHVTRHFDTETNTGRLIHVLEDVAAT